MNQGQSDSAHTLTINTKVDPSGPTDPCKPASPRVTRTPLIPRAPAGPRLPRSPFTPSGPAGLARPKGPTGRLCRQRQEDQRTNGTGNALRTPRTGQTIWAYSTARANSVFQILGSGCTQGPSGPCGPSGAWGPCSPGGPGMAYGPCAIWLLSPSVRPKAVAVWYPAGPGDSLKLRYG